FSMALLRTGLHFIRYRNFKVGRQDTKNLVIVGSIAERDRVLGLLQKAGVQRNIMGTVSSEPNPDSSQFLSSVDRLDEVVYIYKVDEIIFCGKDVSAQVIMHWMTVLGPELDYKIVPTESLSIIGSSSKNTAGELYTVDIQFNIATRMARRNKRVIELAACGVLLIGAPLLIWGLKQKRNYFRNIFAVLFRRKSWVGYAPTEEKISDLPNIRVGVVSPLDALRLAQVDDPTRQRINFFYAKDYKATDDVEILFKAFRKLGR
ncbi:MAG: glycosyl transferase family 2, partial [Phaeodactylibacter sp.]|nr:glycosyl transferase family 2 [Phaeodactylibacter sp.]